MNNMFCPLVVKNWCTCRDTCAWFDRHENQCAVLALSRHLNEITKRLEDLNPKDLELEVFKIVD